MKLEDMIAEWEEVVTGQESERRGVGTCDERYDAVTWQSKQGCSLGERKR